MTKLREQTLREVLTKLQANSYEEAVTELLHFACWYFYVVAEDSVTSDRDSKLHEIGKTIPPRILSSSNVIEAVKDAIPALLDASMIDKAEVRVMKSVLERVSLQLAAVKSKARGRPRELETALSKQLMLIFVAAGFDGSDHTYSQKQGVADALELARNYGFELERNSLKQYASEAKAILDKN